MVVGGIGERSSSMRKKQKREGGKEPMTGGSQLLKKGNGKGK
jgi:hypothetical protein